MFHLYSCDICGQPIEQSEGPGRTLEHHPECYALHDALQRLESALSTEGLARINFTRGALQAIWHRLICVLGGIPRPRNARGQYQTVAGSKRSMERKG